MEERSDAVGLHERRRRKNQDSAVNFSQIRRRPSVKTDINNKFNAPRLGNMTPPETPASPQNPHSPVQSQPALFHNYLRAFCHFDQPTHAADGDDGLLMTTTIRPGDLILVHSVHKNGWADGTVLTTGARGWLPTNYCETFDHPFLRNLLNAMTQFWDLLGAGEDANLSTFVRQDYIRGLIAGVRYLLERADCLHRDAALVQKHAGIRRMRKGLLADLSTLVQIAKRLQETISEPFAGEVVPVLLDDLVTKAFRVVTRAIGFADLLAQETGEPGMARSPGPASLPPTSPTWIHQASPSTISAPPNTGVTTTIDSAVAFPPTPASDKRRESNSPPSARPESAVLTHRLSLVAKRTRDRSGSLASDQLSRAHDECISHIGAFIGLYLHSRPSSELVATTDRLVKASETLLYVVDQVTLHDPQTQTAVQQARINFKSKLDELTKSTRDVFKFSDGADDDMVLLPEQANHLVNVGTSLIRAVGECVIKARKVIEQAGDFEIERARPSTGNRQAVAGASKRDSSTLGAYGGTGPASPDSKRISGKALPPPPAFLRERAMTTTQVADFARPTPYVAAEEMDQTNAAPTGQHKSLPPPPKAIMARASQVADEPQTTTQARVRTSSTSPARKCSVGTTVTASTDAHRSNIRDSGFTAVSEGSTRATTPDHTRNTPDAAVLNSFGSLASLQSAATTDEGSDVESQLLLKTYANELTLNKDGQVTGGSLAALVEQLTTHDTAPDAQFVSAFFLTFRSFTTPRELAQALLHRFEYVGETRTLGMPVRLRVYNVFKGWLEVYWNANADRDALGDIRYFALHKLKPHLPQAGERLVELTRKVTNGYSTGTLTGPLVSGVGKVSTSIGSDYDGQQSAPETVITKNQLAALRSGTLACSSTDFDPLELARQFTILASKTFCEVQPEELLSLEWGKKNTSKARHVRQLCILNTDLAHVVGDTILGPDDPKKRATVIKHWSKVASQCLALNNYESLMAIMCSLNSSVVQRLKRTWEVVSKKTKARLDELNSVVDFSRNHASLRSRLEKPVAPCLPFLGIYLTDLTFVDAGNPKFRDLPGTFSEATGEPVQVINFDKHMRMAKIVSHLQKFQVPYKLTEVPEMQVWMRGHLERMREGNSAMVGHLHRRSLLVEPKDLKKLGTLGALGERRNTEPAVSGAEERPRTAGGTKAEKGSIGVREGKGFEVLLKASFAFKSRADVPGGDVVDERKDGV